MSRYGTFTVDGDLQINDNGSVQSVGGSPTYGNSSTLIYNNTGHLDEIMNGLPQLEQVIQITCRGNSRAANR